ncbi:MAG: substrate-binding domain-containing protein, partial [Proteobacteria bacterium]|nr:substrate-binding domain-containing protein [Pseudomonadota bacterium]
MKGNKNKRALVWVGILALALVFCTTSLCLAGELDVFAGENQVLRISGGTAHIPVMKAAAQKIMTFNPEIQIIIAGGGSGAGIKQVGEGLVDIGNSGRQATDTEVAKYGLKMVKWAIDGVAAVTNPQNPVKSLSSLQLQDIFSGK